MDEISSIHLQASHAMLGTPIPQTLNDGILHGYAAACLTPES
jgi:hypothetical protein